MCAYCSSDCGLRTSFRKRTLLAIPSVEGVKARRLHVIPGTVPSILDMPAGCKFMTRCPHRFEPCAELEPDLITVAPDHVVRCHLYPR